MRVGHCSEDDPQNGLPDARRVEPLSPPSADGKVRPWSRTGHATDAVKEERSGSPAQVSRNWSRHRRRPGANAKAGLCGAGLVEQNDKVDALCGQGAWTCSLWLSSLFRIARMQTARVSAPRVPARHCLQDRSQRRRQTRKRRARQPDRLSRKRRARSETGRSPAPDQRIHVSAAPGERPRLRDAGLALHALHGETSKMGWPQIFAWKPRPGSADHPPDGLHTLITAPASGLPHARYVPVHAGLWSDPGQDQRTRPAPHEAKDDL